MKIMFRSSIVIEMLAMLLGDGRGLRHCHNTSCKSTRRRKYKVNSFGIGVQTIKYQEVSCPHFMPPRIIPWFPYTPSDLCTGCPRNISTPVL